MDAVKQGGPPVEPKCVELANLGIYGSEVQSRMDSGSIPAVLSKDLCLNLCLTQN